ncbi:MAG: helix-turn-helix domain-containing protein [Rhizobiaceae bacterium]
MDNSIDSAIGAALRELRLKSGHSARKLAEISRVSGAMISRIESGQVSASISTLNSLASALQVPLVSLFRETTSEYTDFTFVKNGEGLKSTRIVNEHVHEFTNLALHTRRDLQFGARIVTVKRQDVSPPEYIGHGVVFVQALEGKALYRYGQQEFSLMAGDSISVDAELRHGISTVITPEFTFLTVQAEVRR